MGPPSPRTALVAALVSALLAPAGLGAQPAAPREATRPAAPPPPRPAPTAKPPQGQATGQANGQAAKPPPRPRPRPQGTAKPAAPAPVPVPVPAAAPPPEPEKPAEPLKGSATGAPLPRFAALRSDEVNLRVGPGTKYPIEWLYKRRDLPVRIEREFESWRLIRDQEGVQGWVNQATLVPRRTGVVTDAERTLRATAHEDAAPVARLKPGVILRIRSCEAGADWCQASVQDYRGWIRRTDIWGTFPGEAIQ